MSRVEVVPDGNCFFRSICYWLTGTMNQHHEVRLAVVSFMKEKWSEQGKRTVGKHFHNDHGVHQSYRKLQMGDTQSEQTRKR